MTKLYAQRKDGFDINKVTVVGNPTITDSVARNLSQTDYLAVPFIDFKGKAFCYKTRVKFDDLSIDRNTIFGQYSSNNVDYKLPSLVCEYNKLRLYTPKNGTAWDTYTITDFEMQVNTWYDIELVIDLTNVILKVNDKIILTKACNGITYDIGTNTVCLGTTLNLTSWKVIGSIDLTAFKIYVDGELTYSPTKPVYSLERRKEGFELSKFTVVGSPTITEYGVASGLTTNNYVTFNSVIDTNKTFNFKGSFVYKKATASQNVFHSFATTGGQLAGGCRILLGSTGNLTLWAYTGTVDGRVVLSANNFADGDNIDFEFSFSNNKRELKVSKDGGLNWIIGQNTTLLNFTGEWQGFTVGFDGYVGSINLSQFSITVDGKEVFAGAKYKLYAMRGM